MTRMISGLMLSSRTAERRLWFSSNAGKKVARGTTCRRLRCDIMPGTVSKRAGFWVHDTHSWFL